jgi:hypothetical protein
MTKFKITDIQYGKIIPDNLKILLARDSKGTPENLYVEVYKQQAAMYKNVRLRCNLKSYHAEQNNLSQLLLRVKYEAKALWPYMKARHLKIGQIFVDHRREECAFKRLPLTNSYFLFNAAENALVLCLWGRRFDLELTSQPKYFGTPFISYRTGQPELGISIDDEPFAQKLIDKINEGTNESVIEAAKIFADGFEDQHSISVEGFLKILESHWKYPIEIGGREYVFQTLKHQMRADIEKYIESSRKKQ